MNDTDPIVTVDATGLACPEPLMMATSALARAGGKPVEVSVDTATSRDNILRMAGREGLPAVALASGGGFVVRIGGKKA